jgi:ABC-type branched-subunit amino acid transport system ATPase component
MPTTGSLLEVSDIRASFGGVRALDGATFAVQPGTITGLIGPNGAGKTTVFNCISGLVGGYAGTGIFARPQRAFSRGRCFSPRV